MKLKITFILLILFGFIQSIFAENKKEIVWLQNHRPPWMISKGIHKNKGYGDKIRSYLTSNYLDEYKHTTLPVNPSRALKIIKENNQNICYGPIFKIKTTDDFLYYSKPVYVLPQGRIVVTKDIYRKLNSVDKISMSELIQNPNYTFGKIKGIHFYPIDVKKYENQKNVITLSSSSPVVSLLQMMKKNRIDWIYEYNVFIKWETFLNKDYESQFKTIEVKETKKLPFSIAYMACNKSYFGKEVIDRINKNLTKENILKMRAFVKSWQLDNNTIKTFDKLNHKVFGY